ncbi:MerR family transcriptional regulator [Euzebya sp.]|uniref:MerR family transcriptional regulator n=1 Tax=Euzebya sp. TaxID=1971409 RepID=UPI0035112B7E
MDSFRIAELADRTGFSSATLRYYEDIGLLEQPDRTAAGHRLYDAEDEARVRFIRRAKRMGLSLDEIRDLVAVWAVGECATTRRQLRELVEQKIVAVREQVEEAATFLQQLQEVSERLAAAPEPGEGCGCAPELPQVDTVQLVQIRPHDRTTDHTDTTSQERRDHHRERQRA